MQTSKGSFFYEVVMSQVKTEADFKKNCKAKNSNMGSKKRDGYDTD